MRGESLDPPPEERRPTFGEFAWEWHRLYAKTNNKPSEQRNKDIQLRVHLIPFFGRRRLDAIHAVDVETFKAHEQGRGLSNKTINNALAVLGKLLRCAAEWDRVGSVPRIRLLRAALPPIRLLDDEECRRLLADDGEPVWDCMVLLALRTGMRLGELLGLDWSAVDLAHGVVAVRQSIVQGLVTSPKNHRSRTIPLDQETVASLARLGPLRAGLVFHQADGRPFSTWNAGDALGRVCRRVGVRHVGWHTLRHTFATQLCQERVPIRDVQVLLGHSTLAMTERYAHVTQSNLATAVSVLRERQGNRLVFGPYLGNGTYSMSMQPSELIRDNGSTKR